MKRASQRYPASSNSKNLLQNLLHGIDIFALALSPVAIIGFVFLTIIVLDGFGTHVNFVRTLEENGVVAEGTWYYDGGDDPTAVVELTSQPGEYLVLYVKYYSASTLSSLKEGDMVRVRYTKPPEHEYHAVLEDHFAEVRGYWGYLKEMLWFYAFCWLMAVLHPDLLYLGFPQVTGTGVKP